MRWLYLFLFSTFLIGCSKEEQQIQTPINTSLVFHSLTSGDTIMKVGGLMPVEALATGDNLNFEWISKDANNNSYGSFFGTGSSVEWYVCHADLFYITCTVTDKYQNKESKTITVRSMVP